MWFDLEIDEIYFEDAILNENKVWKNGYSRTFDDLRDLLDTWNSSLERKEQNYRKQFCQKFKGSLSDRNFPTKSPKNSTLDQICWSV